MENKKTIIILSHVGFDNTPYCSYVHSHAKALVKAGYNVIVLAGLRWFPFVEIFKKSRRKHYKEMKGKKTIDGVNIIYFKTLSVSNFLKDSKININGIFYYLAIKRKVKKIIRSNNVIFIDAHTLKIEGYVASKLKRKYKNIFTTVTCHGTSYYNAYRTDNGKNLIKRIAHELDYIVCVSEKFKRELNLIDVKNVKVIYNGINFWKNNTDKNNKNKYGIVTLGSLKKRKNIDIVIKAFSELYKQNKEMRLTIIGEGVLKNKLKDMCKELGIENVVRFEGTIQNEQVYKILQENNIFVLPSVREGFGICYAEAMYNNCITIATKGEGIDGFIKNGENGFLIEPNSDDIVKIIKNILEEKYDIEKIRAKGEEQAKKLTWEKNALEYMKLISKKEQ